jgi:glycosyltransferase 2 family protein
MEPHRSDSYFERVIRIASSLPRIWRWLKWPVSVGIMAWLVYISQDLFDKIADRELKWGLLAAAFGCSCTSVFVQFFRWYLLVKAQGFEFRYRDAMRLGFLGLMFNFVAPGAVGGDVFKAGFLAGEQDSRRVVAVATILLDRILGFIALFAVGAFATLLVSIDFEYRQEIIAILWSGASAGVIGLLIMLHPATPKSRWLGWFIQLKKIGPIVQDLADGISLYQAKRRVILACVMVGIFSHLLIISSFFATALAIGTTSEVPEFTTQMLLLPVAQVVGVIVPLPGGIGALEAAVQESYKLVGAPGGLGFLAASAYRVTTIVVALFGAVYYLSARKQIKQLADK